MKVKVEVTEYISYTSQEIEGYECCIMWDTHKEFLYLYSYRDSSVLEYLEQRGVATSDVVIEYKLLGYDYVA